MIGFVQGRLSPMTNGKIQAFPWDHWRDEFSIANENDFHLIEWTLDQSKLYKNPLMTKIGQKEIKNLSSKYKVYIKSLTGDCFMQEPFYKANGLNRKSLLRDLQNIITSCDLLGIKYIVFPLVDNGTLENDEQEKVLKDGLRQFDSILHISGIKIIFESDFSPNRLKNFISEFPSVNYGINYDIGNSAASGFDFHDEIEAYGHRILNVHIKDRLLHGATVPLGSGNADIPKALKKLKSIGYNGNCILQTARAKDGDHIGTLCQYRDQLARWMLRP